MAVRDPHSCGLFDVSHMGQLRYKQTYFLTDGMEKIE